jgi:predicted XRE-type DNA-binding protein
MKKNNPVAKNLNELIEILGLSKTDGSEIELKSTINDKIINIVNKMELTHDQVAKLAKTSRSRVTAILNRNTHDVSTDLLLRILSSLGYKAKISFSKAA